MSNSRNDSEIAVSVIVPVYNVEVYLEECLESIRRQTLENIEIILVDDGSTDRSGYICDDYTKLDHRISVIHKENGGLTSAWKAGVMEAKARFVGFVDSDDWIDADMFEQMYGIACTEDADMTVAGLVYEFSDGRETKTETSYLTKQKYTRDEIVTELFPILINNGGFLQRTIQPARVTKLYKTEIVKKNIPLCSNEVSIGEDLQLTFSVVTDANTICMLPDYFPYHYRINVYSLTGKYDANYLEKIKVTKRQLLSIVKEKGVYDFSGQLVNDFLGLTIMAIKGEVCKNKEKSMAGVIGQIRKICEDKEVQEALRSYEMPFLPVSVRVFLQLMKGKLYWICYLLAKIAFRKE